MPNFRSPKHQAQHSIRAKTAHGLSRHKNRNSGVIHSIGTERNYVQALSGVGKWLHENHAGDLQNLTTDQAQQYLACRAGSVRQKTLNLDRQALQLVLEEHLDSVESSLLPSKLATASRAYTPEQVHEISCHQTTRYALSTQLTYASGLRACELLSLRPCHERSASAHRAWSTNRFAGRKNIVIFTVAGKGGLIREVALPITLAAKLEERRLPTAKIVTDRGIFRERFYDIAGGKKWSADFSRASKIALGFSLGAHGLRHSFAQERLTEIQGHGFSHTEAMGIVAQELGHFDPSTTEAYLR